MTHTGGNLRTMTEYPVTKYYAPVEIVDEDCPFDIFLRSLYVGGRPQMNREQIADAFDRYDALSKREKKIDFGYF